MTTALRLEKLVYLGYNNKRGVKVWEMIVVVLKINNNAESCFKIIIITGARGVCHINIMSFWGMFN